MLSPSRSVSQSAFCIGRRKFGTLPTRKHRRRETIGILDDGTFRLAGSTGVTPSVNCYLPYLCVLVRREVKPPRHAIHVYGRPLYFSLSDSERRMYSSTCAVDRVELYIGTNPDPQLSDLPEPREAPDCPLSALLLPPLPSGRNESYHPVLLSPEDMIEDFSVNACYIGLVSVWRKIAFRLHEIQSGKVEIPRTSDSTYARLNVKIHECDAHFPQAISSETSSSRSDRLPKCSSRGSTGIPGSRCRPFPMHLWRF